MCCNQYGQLKGSFEVETAELRKKFVKVANERERYVRKGVHVTR